MPGLKRLELAVLAMFACSPRGPALEPDEGPPPDRRVPRPVRPHEAEPPEVAETRPSARGPAGPLDPEDAEFRSEGLRALDEGRYDEAVRRFRGVLERAPGNLATQALLEAASEALARVQADAGASLANVSPTVLARPPFAHALRRRLDPTGASRPPRLVKISEKRNKITDDDAWFDDNDLHLPTLAVPNRFRNTAGSLPQWVPTRYGNNLLVRAIAHPDHTILVFGKDFGDGRFVATFDERDHLISLFDFRAYMEPPQFVTGDRSFVDEPVVWGELADGVLYVSNYHRTYAKSSKRKNGYITALDAKSGELLWRSAPLVCNSRNFLVRGDHIITGYGFTAEPDHLYVLDRHTGKTLSRIRLRTGPSYLIEKAGKLHVRTYDTDYVFGIK